MTFEDGFAQWEAEADPSLVVHASSNAGREHRTQVLGQGMRIARPAGDSAFARAIDQQVPNEAVVRGPLFVEGELKREVGAITGFDTESG